MSRLTDGGMSYGDQDAMLNQFRRLMDDLARESVTRNCFQCWEIDLLLDIQTCALALARSHPPSAGKCWYNTGAPSSANSTKGRMHHSNSPNSCTNGTPATLDRNRRRLFAQRANRRHHQPDTREQNP
jgi:hypothetical protein